MGRSLSRRNSGAWTGDIHCARKRCRVTYSFVLANQPPEWGYNPAETKEVREEKKQRHDAASHELMAAPLPAGWVKLRFMLYAEGDKDNPDFFEFHSPHCAALYLNALPNPKNEEPTR